MYSNYIDSITYLIMNYYILHFSILGTISYNTLF